MVCHLYNKQRAGKVLNVTAYTEISSSLQALNKIEQKQMLKLEHKLIRMWPVRKLTSKLFTYSQPVRGYNSRWVSKRRVQ